MQKGDAESVLLVNTEIKVMNQMTVKETTNSRYLITCPFSTVVSFEVEGPSGLDPKGVQELALQQPLEYYVTTGLHIEKHDVEDMVRYDFLDLVDIEELEIEESVMEVE